MTIARVVETSVSNSPIHDYVHPDNHIPPTYGMNPAFKALTSWKCSLEDMIDVCIVGGGGWGVGVGGGSGSGSTNVCKISRITFKLVSFLILRRSFQQCRGTFAHWSILRLGECQFRALNWHFRVSNEKEKLRYKAPIPAHQESPRVCQESSWYRRTLSAGAVKPILVARRSKNKYTN